MSEQPTAPAPAAKKENVFTHKIGPLPMWGWLAIVAGGLVAWRIYSNKKAAATQQTSPTAPTSTDASQVPQFVNQTYVSTGAPTAPDTTTGAASVPTNPSPVGSQPGAQPKPTTTLGSWSYPAPSGLATYDVAKNGVRLQWNAVTGPSGQHPNSYTVATYNSKNQLVDQFNTQAGNTNTAEYGKGGKGLPAGTYHTNVWANGGPVAPQHASVQYTLKG